MNIELDEEISTERNSTEGHSVDATLTLSFEGNEIGEATVRCNGLAGCGEAFFSEVSFSKDFPNWLQNETEKTVKDAAHDEVKEWWDYNGSNWSEPVEKPDDELVDEPDADHQWVVSRTEFHGGAIVGYAESEEVAQSWIEFKTAGTDCVCGCYGCYQLEFGGAL